MAEDKPLSEEEEPLVPEEFISKPILNEIELGFWFEEYTADNWAVDGLQPYDPAVVENTLLPGNETLDYNVYVITASASYKF